MTNPPNDARTAARKRIEERRSFVPHLIVYLAMNTGLVVLWIAAGWTGFFWPGLLIVLWGIGILMHGWNAYVAKPITDADVDRELERMHQPDDRPR